MPELSALLAESTALITRSAGLCTTFRCQIAGGADRGTPFVIEALARGTACLTCLVSATGLPETQVVHSLRRLSASVIVTVGPCARCGAGEDRLVCGLTS
jgi:hypothetical protein